MLDPIISLAFSMQSNKGVYALLLGSGVSRSSRIPTGWEIVLELIRKVAALQSEECEPSPEAWYVEKFKKAPDYGDLLDMVAKLPAERQALLRSYFEPTESEREEGAKMPTAAHKAIARLVRDGYVRVIVTTNFDRLMERALEEEGVSPVVVSTPDHITGIKPLAHLDCCVVKVHGDYHDSRIRNTPGELAAYTPEMNAFLDRVFDEFGLVTCGWSAEWDTALRKSIERAASRRYSLYWATRGEPGGSAAALITRRAGATIPIDGADQFFEDLQAKVQSIAEFSEPHPLSKAAAVASVKRYLSASQFRIRLADLIDGLAKDLAGALASGPFKECTQPATVELVTRCVKTYDALASTLTAVAYICGRWGNAETSRLLARAITRILAARSQTGYQHLSDFQDYVPSKLAYAALLGASIGRNLEAVAPLFEQKVKANNELVPITRLYHAWGYLHDLEAAKLLQGYERHFVPVSMWLNKTLGNELAHEFASQDEFNDSFHLAEVLLSLAFHASIADDQYKFFPKGIFNYRPAEWQGVKERIAASLALEGERSEYVRAGFLGSDVKSVTALLEELTQDVRTTRRY
ncbi:SIR2 family protein [Paraburkholderia bannensis]|uniref:SIR2 family protein n=1 Tax=Paraburkholderia bannensis TaxID=765414 RepID=UPI002ABD5105|nr:SIR2 family protein [Paraburkholderia bannensis]